MEQKYKVNDRVEYWVKRGKKREFRIGYVKHYKRGLFGSWYYICVGNKDREVDKVRPKRIWRITDYQGKHVNKQQTNRYDD